MFEPESTPPRAGRPLLPPPADAAADALRPAERLQRVAPAPAQDLWAGVRRQRAEQPDARRAGTAAEETEVQQERRGLWSLVRSEPTEEFVAPDSDAYFLPAREPAAGGRPTAWDVEEPVPADRAAPLRRRVDPASTPAERAALAAVAAVGDVLRARAPKPAPTAQPEPASGWAPVRRDPSDVLSFRGLPWGARQSTVREREARPPKWQADDVLAWATTLNGLAVDVAYIFDDDRLVRAKYLVTEQFVDDDRFVEAFHGFQEMLIAKYGFATEDDEQVSDDRVRDDHRAWGRAVSLGQYGRRVYWRRPSGDVCLALQGQYHRVRVEIEYLSRVHSDAAERQRMDDLLADL